MKRSHRNLSIFIGVAAVMLGAPAFAASDASGVKKVEVHYTDAELAQATGAQKIYARISRAARDACEQPRILFRAAVFNDCVKGAIEGAVQSVGHENLTAVHQQSAGSRTVVAVKR